MKSVCILVQNHYEPDIRVRRKAEALVASGYSVDVLALRSSSGKKEYELQGVHVLTIGLGKKRGSPVRYVFEYFAFLLWAFWKLFFLMRKRRYAVVDVNNLPDFLVFAGILAKWKGSKIVFDMHEITPEFYISKYGMREDSWIIWLLKKIEKGSFDFADHVITINEPIAKLLVSRGLPASKCTVITNSVDEVLFGGGKEPVKATSGEPFVMMYHGTLTNIYGLDIAIEAFAKVHQLMPGAEFLILGNGPEKKALEALAARLGVGQKVKLPGSVPPEKVREWLSRCSVGVLPTRRDIFLDYSFSNKLSEYVIMGKGVIASRLKTIEYYFSDRALAYFEPNNAEDLGNQMLRLYRDHDLCVVLASQAKREYAPIGWEVMRKRYLSLMADLIGAQIRVIQGKVLEAAAANEPAKPREPATTL